MEKTENNQPVPATILPKESEERKELTLEDLDIPVTQLLKMYKNREIPRRWSVQ